MGPLHGEHQEFHGIYIQDGIVTPKINAGDSTPISHTPCCEIAVSRIKRGRVEEVVVSHVSLASPV